MLLLKDKNALQGRFFGVTLSPHCSHFLSPSEARAGAEAAAEAGPLNGLHLAKLPVEAV